jgi:5-methylcytosine-specific restriction endonuclease McrA
MDLPFKNTLELNNKIIGSISIFELLKRKHRIVIPYNQRISDEDKIYEIISYQHDHKRRNGFYNFLGTINLHYCRDDKKYYLVDGQHRYNAVKKIAENFEDFDIIIEVIIIEKKEFLLENYNLINKNTPLPELSDNINTITHKLIFLHFEKQFNKIWTLSTRPRRPNLNKNHFQEALSYLIEKLNSDDSNYYIKLISEHNNRVSNWNIDRIGNMKNLKDPNKTLDICRENGCFLGLFPHTTDEFHYRWVSDIIRNETGEEIKKPKKKGKKAIPKVVKNGVWAKYIGNDIGCTFCLVCGNQKIYQSMFTAGHVISEYNNGKIVVDNLRPICSTCNLSMGTRNMGDFVEDHYPENLEKLCLS